ncbi:succinate dehydrogenase assembly factor 2 [Microdochium nivale]|nr:succinate dehydrogenase assembly factor 2 [Microdochium nivale]
MGIGELEESEFKIQPLRRVGEDEETMRARLIYQSRKRGILESDLLLSTFADERLPSMSKEEMTTYDLFLDENDWDIYYWATQETPDVSSSPTSSAATTTTSDTSSAAYAGGAEAEAAIKSADVSSTSTSTPSSSSGSSSGTAQFPRGTSPISPLGSMGSAEAGAAASAAASAEPYNNPGAGEWAQTIGTFKPAYRPVPARWKDSAVLAQLRQHVRARAAAGKGGMAFMPPLRS